VVMTSNRVAITADPLSRASFYQSTDTSHIKMPPSAHLFTCPYSTDATNNPQQTNPNPEHNLSSYSYSLWSCILWLLSSAPFSNRVCHHAVQEFNPFSVCSTRHIMSSVLPTYYQYSALEGDS